MRLRVFAGNYQGFILLLPLFLLFCSRSSEETPVIPPPTNPLIREFIGYGVVNVSFVHVADEPGLDGTSLSYLRKGSLVKIVERRMLNNRGNSEIWVMVDTQYSDAPGDKIRGWLRESNLIVYNNEEQANTAAETMNL